MQSCQELESELESEVVAGKWRSRRCSYERGGLIRKERGARLAESLGGKGRLCSESPVKEF